MRETVCVDANRGQRRIDIGADQDIIDSEDGDIMPLLYAEYGIGYKGKQRIVPYFIRCITMNASNRFIRFNHKKNALSRFDERAHHSH